MAFTVLNADTDVVSLTRKLLSFNTISPPGNESVIAGFVGDLLAGHEFDIEYKSFDANRLHLIAEKGLSSKKAPIVLSGHFDTVPLGNKEWTVDPFAGEVKNGKIWGRGSSDMKGGLAAMILASISAFAGAPPEGGIRIIFTAGEEMGCRGITKLVDEKGLHGDASAVIVGEPTANLPATGHKGAIYLKVVAHGKTAHSSMPELGDNAIYKAARSINKIMDFRFDADPDPLLGLPTVNVGMISGGMNLNSVPDHAEFTIDFRTTTRVDHSKILEKLTGEIGNETEIETLVDLKPVYTPEDVPFIKLVYKVCGIEKPAAGFPMALPYLTDGAVLQRFYKGAPTIILGPGLPEMAHQTDEYCLVKELEKSVNIYKDIIINWRN
jgi:succinyl-diaminopimelate desuccinylase